MKNAPNNKIYPLTKAELLKKLESIAEAKFTKKEFTCEEFKALPESAMSAIKSIEIITNKKDKTRKIKIQICNQDKARKLLRRIKAR